MKLLLLSLLCVSNLNAIEVSRTDVELISAIPVTNSERLPYVLYSIGPLNLVKGNIVDIRLQAVLSNECDGNVGIGRYIVRSKERFSINGKRVVKTVMSNATINDHHAVLIHTGIEEINKSSHGNYYNFVVFAQSTQCEDEILNVEGYNNNGFGELIILIH
jgi:hypothetical protein